MAEQQESLEPTGSETSEQEIWETFDLGPENPDIGGGFLYYLRYNPDHLFAQREQVIKALSQLGVSLETVPQGKTVEQVIQIPPELEFRANALLEELSCVNEAIAYASSIGERLKGVAELVDVMKIAYDQFTLEQNVAGAYEVVTNIFSPILEKLLKAHEQNNVLEPEEFKKATTALAWAQRQAAYLKATRSKEIYSN